jgi:hypothetical protein
MKFFLKEIKNYLDFISSTSQQAKHWKGDISVEFTLTYNELVCGLYDDCHFDLFCKSRWVSEKVNLKKVINDFNVELNLFIDSNKNINEKELLNSLEWKRIVNMSRSVVEKWPLEFNIVYEEL